MNLMTKAEYAKHRNISKPMVSKLVREDRILVTKDGLVDQEISDILMDEFSESPLRNPNNPLNSEVSNYALQRALLTEYKAKLAKLELDKNKGELIDATLVRQSAFSTARRVRDAILSIPDRISSILAAESDQATVKNLLTQELRLALEELSNEIADTNI